MIRMYAVTPFSYVGFINGKHFQTGLPSRRILKLSMNLEALWFPSLLSGTKEISSCATDADDPFGVLTCIGPGSPERRPQVSEVTIA